MSYRRSRLRTSTLDDISFPGLVSDSYRPESRPPGLFFCLGIACVVETLNTRKRDVHLYVYTKWGIIIIQLPNNVDGHWKKSQSQSRAVFRDQWVNLFARGGQPFRFLFCVGIFVFPKLLTPSRKTSTLRLYKVGHHNSVTLWCRCPRRTGCNRHPTRKSRLQSRDVWSSSRFAPGVFSGYAAEHSRRVE